MKYKEGTPVEFFLMRWELLPNKIEYIENNLEWTEERIRGEKQKGVWIKGTIYQKGLEDYLIKLDEQYEDNLGWDGEVRIGEGGRYWWTKKNNIRLLNQFIGGTREKV